MMKWDKKVRILLKDRPVSWLARECDIPQTTLSQSLNEGVGLNPYRGVDIAEALGVSAHWLFDDSKDMDDVEYLERPTNESDLRRRRVKSAVDFFNDDSPELQHTYEIVVQLLHDRVAEEKRVIDTKPHPMRRKTDKPHTAGSAV